MIDIITVVFRNELPVLQAQAQSVERYCQDIGIRNIYVVVNDSEEVVSDIDASWWGALSNKVLVIPRSAFGTSYSDNGWLSQQALKLMTAAVSYNVWSMVLDAKTIFVKPLQLNKLLDDQGRPCVGQLDIYPVFERSKQIVDTLFGINLQKQLGPGGVPFIINNRAARAMIADVETRTSTAFPEWFQAQGMLTEFILYSGYVHLQGGFDWLYNVNSCEVAPVNICHSEVAAFDRKFKEMQNSLTVSIHRNAWTELTAEQRQQYQHFLIDRSIIAAWKL